jgi:hypothetical protein
MFACPFRGSPQYPANLLLISGLLFMALTAAVAGAMIGCSDSADEPIVVAFADVMRLESTIPLETSDSVFVGGFNGAIAWSGNRFILADPLGCNVFSFSSIGRFLGTYGRRGTGPGEYTLPTRVCPASLGKVLVYDNASNAILVFDSLGSYASSVHLSGWAVSQWGSNDKVVRALGIDFTNSAKFVLRGFEDTSFVRLSDITSTFEFPTLLRNVSILSQLCVDETGCTFIIDPLSCRITRISLVGEILTRSTSLPSGFVKPADDLHEDRNQIATRSLLEKLTPIVSVAQLKGLLFIVWVNRSFSPNRIQMEVYSRQLRHMATVMQLPKDLTPWIFSDGECICFTKPGPSDKSGEPTNPVIMRYSTSLSSRLK